MAEWQDEMRERELHGYDLALAMMYGVLRSHEETPGRDYSGEKTVREAPIKAEALRTVLGYLEDERARKYGSRSEWAARIAKDRRPEIGD